MECLLVLGTWALVGVTYLMMRRQIEGAETAAREQLEIAKAQAEAVRVDLKVRLQLLFAERFDALSMVEARRRLAQQLYESAPHAEIQEAVMDFYEDLGLVLKRGYLDEEMAWSTFGFYAVRWWGNCRSYVQRERKETRDPTVFEDFEALVGRFRARDQKAGLSEPDDVDLKQFIDDERKQRG